MKSLNVASCGIGAVEKVNRIIIGFSRTSRQVQWPEGEGFHTARTEFHDLVMQYRSPQ